MLRRLDETVQRDTVAFTFNGVSLTGRSGSSIAVALLENDILSFRRSPASGEARSPFCLMGVCFECLVIVDNCRNRQACLTQVAEGMCIQSEGL